MLYIVYVFMVYCWNMEKKGVKFYWFEGWGDDGKGSWLCYEYYFVLI